uniref:Uncharacterized protein n=1 Tax=Tanacetum cinerariifolium TaxID=118510 RepID=A0A699JEM7_TANCI|nr:hypothetical protein [Tanacetum cinerariifolium]
MLKLVYGEIKRVGLLGIMDFNILLLLFILSAAAWNYRCAIFLAVASLFFWQWHLSLLAVGSWSASRNSYNWQWVDVLPVGTLITGNGKLQASSESCSSSRNSCESSNSNHFPSESNFPLEACSRSSQVPDPFLEGSPSLLA